MKSPEVDLLAIDRAVRRHALPHCLHIPLAARNEQSIERFIGRVKQVVLGNRDQKALLVEAYDFAEVDPRLPIWNHPNVAVLRRTDQVWVHVDLGPYRRAYRDTFPDERLTGLVIDHVINRRVARLKNFSYLRVVPISRGANSSSGGLAEKWAVAYHSSPKMIQVNADSKEQIQYADISDLVKMLDIKTGGSLQDPVNEAQVLVEPASRESDV
jgi:hypothetical protein